MISATPETERITKLIRDVAAEEILPRFGHLAEGDIREKGPGDLVTTADVEAERRLTAALTALLPDSVVVGEEAAAGDPGILDALGGDRPVWLVDPVDGTLNFARGHPCFAVILAYVHRGDTVAAWIHDPVAGETMTAKAGEGVWLGNERQRAAAGRPLTEMKGALGNGLRRRVFSRLKAEGSEPPTNITRYGCAGREYMDVASGKLDFLAYGGRLKPWDHAAGVLFHREAGGYGAFIDDGSPYGPGRGIVHGSLLLAPDRDSWSDLQGFVNGG